MTDSETSLKNKTISGIRATSISMGLKAVMQLLQVVILARYLNTSDFGLMALVLVSISFAQLFTDLGISNAIIHYKNISNNQLSSLFWLNIIAGMLAAITLFSLAPIIAAFYGEPTLEPLLQLTSCYFFVISLGQQLRILAEKNLKFMELAKLEISSSLLGLIGSVSVAIIYKSVFALVIGLLITGLSNSILAWIFLSNNWRPKFRIKILEVLPFLKYGGYVIVSNFINTFNSQIDVLIGGRFFGAETLGQYNLPRDLSLRLAGVINPIVTRVGLPVMAKVQDNKEQLRSVYLKTIRMTASINFPCYCALAIFAPEVIFVVFGEKWAGSAIYLQIFAVWGLFRSVINPMGSLLYSTGNVSLNLKWNLALLFLMPPTFYFSASLGPQYLALSSLIIVLLAVPMHWFFILRKVCNLHFKEYHMQIFVPLLISSISSILAFYFSHYIEAQLLRVAVGLLVGLSAYVLLSWKYNIEWFEAMCTLLKIKV